MQKFSQWVRCRLYYLEQHPTIPVVQTGKPDLNFNRICELIQNRHNGVRTHSKLNSLAVHRQSHCATAAGRVFYYRNLVPVGIFKGDGIQLFGVVSAIQPCSARVDKLGKVRYIVVAGHKIELSVFYVHHNGRFAIISDVCRSALSVQAQVPIDPTFGIVIEVVYYMPTVAFAVLPSAHVGLFAGSRIVSDFGAAFR